jgi:fumarylacetoacetase
MKTSSLSSLNTWVHVPVNSDFTIYNLPYGVFKYGSKKPRVGVAIGEHILDLSYLYKKGYLDQLFLNENVFKSDSLNRFIALGKPYWTLTRKRLMDILKEDNGELRDKKEDVEKALIPMKKATLLMPVKVGNYTDFYSSMEHASNVGKMFRPDGEPLLPNWKHIPVGYHGRASSIVVSGTPIHRPKGQTMPEGATTPVFGPTKQLDFELEMGFIIGRENELGTSITTDQAEQYIFGMLIFNDWSARDIQKWEYVPLGPFLSKNFASSVSPWVVTMDALEPFRCAGPVQDPPVLPYLRFEGEKSFDIHLEVYLQPEGGEPQLICESNHKYLYWNISQQLAHHTVNGCNMKIGDICASGTISGPTENSYGSMLELTWRGTRPIRLANGTERKFIEDGDTVIMKAYCKNGNLRVGFGSVKCKVLPAM